MSLGTSHQRERERSTHASSMQPPRPGQTAPPPTRSGSGAVIRLLRAAPAVVALAAVLVVAPPVHVQAANESGSSTLCNVPPTLSGEDRQAEKIKHPRSASAARCVSRCVSTCVLGGAGAPGIGGPFNTRRPLVVFKDDFRSRQYCLVECSDICNLIKDGEEGE